MEIADFGQRKCSASNSINSWLAFPSTGGDFSRAIHSPPFSSSSLTRALGFTRTRIFAIVSATVFQRKRQVQHGPESPASGVHPRIVPLPRYTYAAAMLAAIPQSLCSWNYHVSGATAGDAELTFDWFTEQGTLTLGNRAFLIRKYGIFSGHWSLDQGDRTAADAVKPNPLARSFAVTAPGLALTVRAQHAFTRSYDILSNGGLAGTIVPAHAFTRRAFIDCLPNVPEHAQLFAFWLAALTWKRAANSSSSTAAGS